MDTRQREPSCIGASHYYGLLRAELSQPQFGSAGYLGAQVHLVKGQAPGGTLCGSTPWQFNTSNSPFGVASRNWTQSSNCPAGVGYYSSAHGEYWNANTSKYKKSNWINSPSLNLP